MKQINYEIEIIDDNCTGCFRCERACPTSAITMTGPRKAALAVVDNSRCIACMRCIDSCDDDAMLARRRDEPLVLGVSTDGVDRDAIRAICHAAGMEPSRTVCFCSASSAREVAAAILTGATTFEDLALQTGVQSGCLMYCSVPIRRLLEAHLGQADATSKVRRYQCDQALPEIPVELALTYPTFHIEQEQEMLRARFERDARHRGPAPKGAAS